jgi:hypothetical protein
MSAVECPRVLETVGNAPDSPLGADATFRSAPKATAKSISVKLTRQEGRCGAILSMPLPQRTRAIDGLSSQCQRQDGYFDEGGVPC